MPRGGSGERADARRNRRALIDAARAEIAEVGLDVSINAVVRRAGLGSGTFYRRFASRPELLETVLMEVVAELEAVAQDALEHEEPAAGLRYLFVALVERQIAHKGLTEAMGTGGERAALGPARARLQGLVRRVVDRAVVAGTLRADVRWQDLPFAAGAVAAMPSSCLGLEAAGEVRERLVDAVLAGYGSTPDRDADEEPAHRG